MKIKIKVSTPSVNYGSKPKSEVIEADTGSTFKSLLDEARIRLNKTKQKVRFCKINGGPPLVWNDSTCLSDLGLNDSSSSVLIVFEKQYIEPRENSKRAASDSARLSIINTYAREKAEAKAKRDNEKKRKERAKKSAMDDKFNGGGRTIGGRSVMAPAKKQHKPTPVVMHGDGKRLSDGKVMIEGGVAKDANEFNLSHGGMNEKAYEDLLLEMSKNDPSVMAKLESAHFDKAIIRLLCDPSTTDDAQLALKDREKQEWERVIIHCLMNGTYIFKEGVPKGNVLGGGREELRKFFTVELRPKVSDIFTKDQLKFVIGVWDRQILLAFVVSTFRVRPGLPAFQPSVAIHDELKRDILWSFVYHANSDGLMNGTVREFYKAVCPRVDWDYIEEPNEVRERKLSEKALENERQFGYEE